MRTDLSTSRAPEEEEDGAVILACCVFSVVVFLTAVFGADAWPLIWDRVVGVFA